MKTSSKKEKQGVVEEIGNDLAAELRRVIDGYDAEAQRLALAKVLGEMLAPMGGDMIQEQYDEQAYEEARDELCNTILQSGKSYAEQADMYKVLLSIMKERMGKKLKQSA